MLKRYITFLVLLFISCEAFSQLVTLKSDTFDADSIRREFDNGPYFTLYKDNYFILGGPIGEKPTGENSGIKFQVSIAQRLTKSTLPFNTYLFLMYSQ